MRDLPGESIFAGETFKHQSVRRSNVFVWFLLEISLSCISASV